MKGTIQMDRNGHSCYVTKTEDYFGREYEKMVWSFLSNRRLYGLWEKKGSGVRLQLTNSTVHIDYLKRGLNIPKSGFQVWNFDTFEEMIHFLYKAAEGEFEEQKNLHVYPQRRNKFNNCDVRDLL